jgi:hypothetical protein
VCSVQRVPGAMRRWSALLALGARLRDSVQGKQDAQTARLASAGLVEAVAGFNATWAQARHTCTPQVLISLRNYSAASPQPPADLSDAARPLADSQQRRQASRPMLSLAARAVPCASLQDGVMMKPTAH